MIQRSRHVFWGLSALAIVIAVIGVVHAVGPGASPGGAPGGLAAVTRDDGGVRLTLSTLPGPYFTGELLPVTLTLTNNSGTTVSYVGTLPSGLCTDPALDVRLSSGGQDISPLAVVSPMPSCPYIPLTAHPLAPSKTLRLATYVGLPGAGLFALKGTASFAPGARVLSPGLFPPPSVGALSALQRIVPGIFRSEHPPFAAGWPVLTMRVSPRVPVGRTLRIALHGRTVYVYAPGAGRSGGRPPLPLLAQQAAMDVLGTGTCETAGAGVWSPLTSGVAQDQDSGCGDGPGGSEKWQVLAGAPGYAIADAVYCFNPTPSMVFGDRDDPHGMGPACTETMHGQ